MKEPMLKVWIKDLPLKLLPVYLPNKGICISTECEKKYVNQIDT